MTSTPDGDFVLPTIEPTPMTSTTTPAERAAAIGSRLRRIFDDAAAEPLPDAFEDLLRRLE